MKKYLTYLLLAAAVLIMLAGWFFAPADLRTPVLGIGLAVAVAALISAIVIPDPEKEKKAAAKQSGLEGVTPSNPASDAE